MDIVVAVVVAVGGRSPLGRIDCPDVGGSRPVSSSFLIRDFKSSSSSQTVEGAVVEIVPSSDCPSSAERGILGEEKLYILGVEKDERFDCLYACALDEPATDGALSLRLVAEDVDSKLASR